MAKKVVLAGACRTAIGTMGGGLSTVPAADLGTIVIKEALKRANVAADQVDEVLMGCVIQAGLGQNVARQASINAGLPVEVPATTINIVCGSGLNCVNLAATKIIAGDADIVVAGGMENMSMAPFCLDKARFGYRMNNGVLKDCMVNDALTDAFHQYHMGITAENVAEQWGLTREELDEFAANSQQKAAAAIVVMSEEKAKELGVTPMATWVAGALGGVDPAIMGVGPVAATKKVLAKTGMSIDDFDLIEANEAFASQSLAVGKELGFDPAKLNVNGGAIALGHPVGASGCRILVTLLHEMQKRDAKAGLATLCIGGGMGCATIVKRD